MKTYRTGFVEFAVTLHGRARELSEWTVDQMLRALFPDDVSFSGVRWEAA